MRRSPLISSPEWVQCSLVGPGRSNHDGLRDATVETVNGLLEEIIGHEDGTFMAACYKEAFMESWQRSVRLVDPSAEDPIYRKSRLMIVDPTLNVRFVQQ